MENSHIEWTHNTFNIAEGCEKVSPGCKNCYAETRDKHWHGGCHWGSGSSRKMMSESYWQKPIKWNEHAEQQRIQTKVFCSSLCDVFEDHPDLTALRERLFKLIARTPNLIWQLLTKRPENILSIIPTTWLSSWPANVWMGTTVESQEYADIRVPILLNIPAEIKFLSCEPLLGHINLTEYMLLTDTNEASQERIETVGWGYNTWSGGFEGPGAGDSVYDPKSGISWLICGGESGPKARPMHPDWARSLRDQCARCEVPFFFKQWGEYRAYATKPVGEGIPLEAFKSEMKIYRDGEFFTMPKDMSAANAFRDFICFKVGKEKAGALLDSVEYKEFPES